MSIKLDYILKRNRSNINIFITKNKLTSYLSLVEYCKSRRFIPCTEEEYNEAVKGDAVQNESRKKATRSTSKTQEPKKRRYRRKKQQDSSKLSDSTDKR